VIRSVAVPISTPAEKKRSEESDQQRASDEAHPRD
jgi:hypothetical protein